MDIVVRLERAPFSPEHELTQLLSGGEDCGGVVSFVGVARRAAKAGGGVDRLVLEDHPTLTVASLEQIARECASRFEVERIRVVHRCGEIAAGEPIVFAGAAAAHRRAAFDAADYLMDRLKTEAVLWKREEGADGSRWIEPTGADYAARERWG